MNDSSGKDNTLVALAMSPVFDRIAWRLMPLLVACYLAAFLDRVNVGFAAILMRPDTNLSGTAFGLGSGAFYVTYFFFEVPSNLAIVRFGARRWIARIMITWGIVSALTAFVWNGPSFFVVRLLMGAAEAGFYPGILYYLTRWFPDRRRARILSLLLLANPLAVIIGAPLSSALLSTMVGVAGLRSWQWLFVMEALPAVILGIVVLFCLPDDVDGATWLSPDERRQVRSALDADAGAVRRTATVELRQVFTSPSVLGLALIFLGVTMTNVTANFWLPQIIKQSGYSLTMTGLLTAIPYVAGVAGLLFWGWHSDRSGERRWHVIAPLLLAAAGVALAAASSDATQRIVGFTVSVSALFAVLPVFWTLPPRLLVGTAAAAGIAVINSVGNLGGLIGPSIMGFMVDRTGSFADGLALLVVVLLVASAIALVGIRNSSA